MQPEGSKSGCVSRKGSSETTSDLLGQEGDRVQEVSAVALVRNPLVLGLLKVGRGSSLLWAVGFVGAWHSYPSSDGCVMDVGEVAGKRAGSWDIIDHSCLPGLARGPSVS